MNVESADIIEILKKSFPSIYERELQEEIASVGVVRSFPTGSTLMDIGSYIKSVPLVVEGSIKVLREDEQGHEIFLYYVDSSNTCAMSLTCCLGFEKSKIRAVVDEETTIISIPVQYMDEWMNKYSSWKNFVMMTYSHRFEELLKTIDLIAFHKMDERLWMYLTNKSRVLDNTMLNVTHQEIAYELNSSREAISRLLKKLEKMGKIKLYRNRIELLENNA